VDRFNGVAGTLTTNTLDLLTGNITPVVLGKTFNVNGQVTQGNGPSGLPITITVSGGSTNIMEGGQPVTINPVVAGKRTLLTASEALALFQNTRSGSTTGQVTLSARTGTTGGTITGGAVTLDESALAGPNTAFKLPAGLTMNISGARPILKLAAGSVIAGNINFVTPDAIAFINAGKAAFTVRAGASITSAGTLIISGGGGTWTNNGTIDVGQLVLARTTTGPLTFITGSGGTTRSSEGGSIVIGPSVDAGINMTFKALGAAEFSMPITFGSFVMPASYGAVPATKPLAVTLNFMLESNAFAAITPVIGGTLNANSLTINGKNITVSTHLVSTPIQIADGASFSLNKSLAITGTGLVAIGNNVSLSVGALSSTAPAYGAGLLDPKSAFVSIGTLSIKSTGTAGISIGSDDLFSVAGTKLLITTTALNANILIGDNDSFLGFGSNVSVLAHGNVAGGTGDIFQSQGTIGTATGGIEVGGGITTATLGGAFSKPKGASAASSFGTAGNIVYNNTTGAGTSGIIIANRLKNGTIDLTTGGQNATFNTTAGGTTALGGAIVVDATGPNSVTFSGVTFNTESSKGVSMDDFGGGADIIVDTGDDETPPALAIESAR
jgi:hypothetical protein